nr:MAG TPA: hypothetical protein [Caudoviricetes sp.]
MALQSHLLGHSINANLLIQNKLHPQKHNKIKFLF